VNTSFNPSTAPASFGKVAVLMGGRSGEREVSLLSGQGVLNALRTKGVNAHAFDPRDNNLMQLAEQGFDRAFVALHGRYGEDGTVQGALELMGIPYTGSGVMASAIALDKAMTKRLWSADGISTPAQFLWQPARHDKALLPGIAQQLGLPLIVKPSREGSSLGVTKVQDLDQLEGAVNSAAALDSDVLIEAFIDGDELTCPVIGTGDQAYCLPVIKIVAPQGRYDYQAKYFTDDTQYLIPCGLDAAELSRLEALTLSAYRAVNARGWGRIDVMVDKRTRQPYLLEINTSPGMTSHSLVPMAAKAIGMAYEDLCLTLLASATLDYAE
jgi:D-alanine-D-alanine ligase